MMRNHSSEMSKSTFGLVRTPEPMGDESPHGYLLRLADANGMSLQRLIELATRKSEYVATVGWNFQLLQPLLGKLDLPPSFGYRPEKYVRGRLVLQGHRLNTVCVDTLKARICPICVETLGYVPAAWDLKHFIACPTHGVMMLQHCEACGHRIRYRRTALQMCDCGADLRTAKLLCAPRELVGLCEILRAKVSGIDHAIVAAVECGFPIKELLACDLAVLCKIIMILAKVLLWSESSVQRPRSEKDIDNRLPEVARILSDWPVQFVRFCRRWHENLSANRKILCFQNNFRWLYTHLYKNLRRKKEQLLFMAREGLVYAGQHWDGSPVKVKDASLRPALANRRFGSFSDAAKLLGWTTCTTLRWLANGRLPARSVGTKKRPIWVVDLDELRNLKLSKHPAVGVRAAAPILGVPHLLYRSLRRGRLITDTYQVNMKKSVSREDLEIFRKSLFCNARPAPARLKLYPLRQFMCSQVPIAHKVEAIREIKEGRLAVYLSGGRSIGSLSTEIDLVARCRETMRSALSELGVYEVARLFNLGFYEARAIILSVGAVMRHCDKGDRLFAERQSVVRFLEARVPLRHIANEMNVDSRALRREIIARKARMLDFYSSGRGSARQKGNTVVPFVRRWAVDESKRIAKGLQKTKYRGA